MVEGDEVVQGEGREGFPQKDSKKGREVKLLKSTMGPTPGLRSLQILIASSKTIGGSPRRIKGMRSKEEEALVTMARPVVEEGAVPKTDSLAIRNINDNPNRNRNRNSNSNEVRGKSQFPI